MEHAASLQSSEDQRERSADHATARSLWTRWTVGWQALLFAVALSPLLGGVAAIPALALAGAALSLGLQSWFDELKSHRIFDLCLSCLALCLALAPLIFSDLFYPCPSWVLGGLSLMAILSLSSARQPAPFTRAGFFLFISSLLVFAEATAVQDQVLLFATVALLATLIILSLSTLISAHYVRQQSADAPPMEPRSVAAGRELATGLALPIFKRNPLIQSAVSWSSPPVREHWMSIRGLWLYETLSFLRRGEHQQVWRRWRIEDPFSLSMLEWVQAQTAALTVTPARGIIRPEALPQLSEADGFSNPAGRPEGDLLELRRYQPGDPMRLILWKVFARSRRLIVRTPERSLNPEQSWLIYFVSGPTDEASASSAQALIERLFGREEESVLFFADGVAGAAEDRSSAQRALIQSADAESGRAALAVQRKLQQDPARGLILLIPERLSEAACEKLTPLIQLRRGAQVLISLGAAPRAQTRRPSGPLERLWWWLQRSPDQASASSPAEVLSLYERWRTLGVEGKLIAQPSGELIAPKLLREAARDAGGEADR